MILKYLLFTLFAAMLASSACMKKPNLEETDGPALNPQEVSNALVDAWGDADMSKILVKEFAYYEKSLSIAQTIPRVFVKDGKTVTSIEDTPEHRIFNIVQQLAEVTDNDQQKLSTREIAIGYKKNPATNNVSSSPTIPSENPAPNAENVVMSLITRDQQVHTAEAPPYLPTPYEIVSGFLKICVPKEGWDVSCHNLKTYVSTEAAPPLIAEQPDCAQLTNCKIRKKIVEFDLIVTYKDEESDTEVKSRGHYTLKLTNDTPYFSKVTDFCFEGLVKLNGQQYPAKICQTMRNFNRGGQ